jgi:hypothetical protein
MNNRKGQWIILSGLILALGLISLVILLNQAMSAGYKVSHAETDFPSHEITEIYEETVRSAKLVWLEVGNYSNNETLFKTNMTDFASNISKIYAAHGILLKLNVRRHSSVPNIANISMHYYDGKVNFTLGTTTKARMIQLPVP